MTNKELISVIVPIFNTEVYLRECLESLKNQTYKNLEIILVNDGSTDNSRVVCEEYCRKDERFILINQKNQGLGMSRNAGLKQARGKYVCFVDSDDIVHEKYVEILYKNLIDFHADISMCSYMKFSEEKRLPTDICNICSDISRIQMLYDITTTGPENISEKIVIACNKMISMDIMKHLRFVDRLHEDEFMINQLLLRVTHAAWTDAVLYFYRQHSESITGTRNKKDIRHLDVLDAIFNRLTLFSGAEYKELFPDMLRSYFDNSAYIYYSVLSPQNKWELMRRIYPRYFKTLLKYAGQLKVKKFLRYMLFLINPAYYRKRYWT